ncbi:O-antigen ligase family protein [Flagellimonas zhangzhouensis]|uniref:O-Antigen ligase n=1 Tax=Flagellimonas zhangzhouensis TaxID=1073328 RepID=A0A1H2UR07_9FLAO|nr:O-antigen ligase family protein [Allomuricauda zhangzhouensis]SDQ14641.1 O-Antigen ligase [Allomuricauda zhangzhouensis]SDW58522.1 O-Antigen ligase [Allomuricauda zhangzhouensis]
MKYLYGKNNILIYSVALLPLLSLKMVSVSIILFVLGACLGYEKHKVGASEVKLILVFSTLFFLYIISLIWTDDFAVGLKQIEKKMSFLIFPTTLFLLKPFKSFRNINTFIKVYLISCAISSCIILLYIGFNLNEILQSNSNYVFSIKLRQAINSAPFIGEHPIYFSLLLAVSVLLLIYNRFSGWAINALLFSIYGTTLLIASSRGVILGLFVVMILIVFQNIKSRNKRYAVLTLLFIMCFSSYLLPPIKARVNEIIFTKHLFPKGLHYNSFNLRMGIYSCSFDIIKDAPIYGYGPADVQDRLDACYETKFETPAYAQQIYNTHNQYLDYLASFGILGFVLIICCFAYFIKISLGAKTNMYFNFLILFFLVLLTENLLSRNTGIVLFAAFNSLLAFTILYKSKFLNT